MAAGPCPGPACSPTPARGHHCAPSACRPWADTPVMSPSRARAICSCAWIRCVRRGCARSSPRSTWKRSPSASAGHRPGAPRRALRRRRRFSDDASRPVVWRTDRDQALSVDVATGKVTRLDPGSRDADQPELAPLPDGDRQLWSDGTVTLYDGAGRAVQELDAPPGPRTRHRGPTRRADRGHHGRRRTGRALERFGPDDGRWSLGESLVGHSLPPSRPRSPPTASRCSPLLRRAAGHLGPDRGHRSR